jgi:hypothetical protein
VLSVLVLTGNQMIHADTVTYSTLPGGIPNPFDLGGVSAASSGSLVIATGFGLAIAGGAGGPIPIIDGTESATFTFDAGGASAVSFGSSDASVGSNQTDDDFKITGFGVGGTSLGTVEVNFFTTFPTFVVSSLFGNATLSAFSISGDGPGDGGLDVASITFSPTSAAVPEPSTLLPAGLGLMAISWFALRRFRHAGYVRRVIL